MLELVGVDKTFGRQKALDGLNLHIDSGRVTVLLGPSGCGKSTALRIMVGLIGPDRGSVRFEGAAVEPEHARTLRHRMGYVIQDGGLFPHLDARGNVCLMASYLGWDRQRIESRLSELVELTRFPADGLDRYPVQLSGGQQQRVSLMRALMLDPDVLLLDEPLGALDPLIRTELQTQLKTIFSQLKKTVVMVTHDLAEAAYFADEIVLLRDGRIAQRGSARDLFEQPSTEFVSRFIMAQRSHVEILAKEML